MSLFPVQADSCTFVVAAPAPEDPFVNGVRLAAAGNFTRACLAGAVNDGVGGLRFDANGAVLVVDSSAGLPANTTYSGGLPISPAGALCVGSGPTASYNQGMSFIGNGSLKGGIV
jgi:hypothetical protein